MTLDQVNLSQQVLTATFLSPAPTLTVQVFQLATPNPGPDPALIEATVTVDSGQHYAAFATKFFDVDDNPGFLFVLPAAPGFQHQLPNRYLVHSK